VSSSEGIVNVDFSQRSQLLPELSNFCLVGLDLLTILDALALFLKVVSQILKKNNLSIGGLLDGLLNFLSDTVIEEFNLVSKQSLELRCNWGK